MINPARKVTDGELIVVGAAQPPAAAGAPGAGQPTGAGAVPGAKVNLNTATLAQVDALPGVGPVLAQRIVATVCSGREQPTVAGRVRRIDLAGTEARSE